MRKRRTRKPPKKKRTGELGSTLITGTPAGPVAKIIHVALPDEQRRLEAFFASAFVKAFNERQLLGNEISISNLRQNDTHDLDFAISCPVANYLELAELHPRSEAFGRAALRSGKLNVYEYARWIWFRLIEKKARSYGDHSSRVILALYFTHWQFMPSESVIECLHSFVRRKGCPFAAVFVLMTNGTDLNFVHTVHPYDGPDLPAVSQYSGVKLTNVKGEEVTPQVVSTAQPVEDKEEAPARGR